MKSTVTSLFRMGLTACLCIAAGTWGCSSGGDSAAPQGDASAVSGADASGAGGAEGQDGGDGASVAPDGFAGDAGAAADGTGATDAQVADVTEGDAGGPGFDAGVDATSDDGAAPDAVSATGGVGFHLMDVVVDETRTLPAAVWYPAEVSDGDPRVNYYDLLPGDAVQDAPLSPGGPYPVVVFSHGHQGIKEQSIFLCEGLARAGFVVVAPDHVGNTAFDFNPALTGWMAIERPRDLSAVLDRLEAPEPDDPAWFATALDLDRVAVAGHSYGGYTTLAFAGAPAGIPQFAIAYCADHPDDEGCKLIEEDPNKVWHLGDDRVRAAIAMAPAGFAAFGPEGLAQIAVPVMVMAAKDDTATPYALEALPIYQSLSPPKALWTSEVGGHMLFSDVCEGLANVPPALVPPEALALCAGDHTFAQTVGHDLIVEAAVAFLRWTLQGDEAARDALASGQAGGGATEVTIEVELP